MPAQGIFLLDKTKPKYFTCGRVALFLIIIFTLISEGIELFAYVFGGKIPTSYEMFYEIIEYIITCTLIIGFVKEWGIMLIPFIGQTFIITVLLILYTIIVFYCCVFPYSRIAENFLSGHNFTFWQREQRFLTILAFMALFTTFISWCLQAALTSYQYFEDRAAERKTKESRPPISQNPVSRPPLVQPSFVNPNFSIEEEDDKVFEDKQKNPAQLV